MPGHVSDAESFDGGGRMKISREHRTKLMDYYWYVLRDECLQSEASVFHGDVLNTRCKTRAVAAVRRSVVKRLRETVGQQRGGHKSEILKICIFGARPDDWEPLSYPMLARLLGLHHSALVYGQRQFKQATVVQDSASPRTEQ